VGVEKIKKKKLGLAILITTSVLGVFAAFVGGIFIFQRAYADEIYPNVYFEDVKLSGLSPNQAKYVIKKRHDQILTREITLKAGEKSVVVKLADTGLSYDVDKVVSESYQKGRASNFLLSVKSVLWIAFSKQKVRIDPIIDQAKYEAFSNLILPQLNNEMKNAGLAIVNGEIVETKEVVGQTVKTEGLPEKILSLANNAETKEIKLDTQIVQPDVKSTNFGPAKAYANKILNKKITLTYENFSFTPIRSELGDWLDFSNQGGTLTALLDDSAIKSYLSKIALNFEVQKVNKKINALDNSVIQEGKEGKYLDKNDALNKIKSQINNLEVFSVALVTNIEAPSEERVIPEEGLIPGRFPGAYIDIDLAQQKLCRIDGNNILACYTVSTGKASTPTPTGTRTIQDKSDRAWSAKYGLWMPWWNGMGGGFGIHELPEWPSGYKEGEAHLGTPVSHGCVRLGVGAAKEVYDWTTIGMPVYIHK
jgi:hypothetical protein